MENKSELQLMYNPQKRIIIFTQISSLLKMKILIYEL